jgi:hypothetical protein
LGIIIEVSEEHPSKEAKFNFVTPLGIIIEVSEEQVLKQKFGNTVISLERIHDVIKVIARNDEVPMFVIVFGIPNIFVIFAPSTL